MTHLTFKNVYSEKKIIVSKYISLSVKISILLTI
jgi:hypothetical protein